MLSTNPKSCHGFAGAKMFAREFRVGDRWVGQGHPVFIIAEAGVSHFGSLEKAYRLVDMAVEAKADVVKFQIFRTNEMIAAELKDWRDRMSTRELPYQDFIKIAAYCKSKGIMF